jgi:hypothetical protein
MAVAGLKKEICSGEVSKGKLGRSLYVVPSILSWTQKLRQLAKVEPCP